MNIQFGTIPPGLYWYLPIGGTPVNASIDGGTGPFVITLAIGLPLGLTISGLDDLFIGACTTLGTYTPQITVQDSLGNVVTQDFVWQVVPSPTLLLSPALPVAIPTLHIGVPIDLQFYDLLGSGVPPYSYSQVANVINDCCVLGPGPLPSDLSTMGGGFFPCTGYDPCPGFNLPSGLPDGLVMSSSGHITGTPTNTNIFWNHPTSGVSQVVTLVTVIDTVGNFGYFSTTWIARPASALIIPSCPGISSEKLAIGIDISKYGSECQIPVSGGIPPYTFAIVSGNLPAGITLTPAGTFIGTPSGLYNSPPFTVYLNLYPFVVRVTDSIGATAQNLCELTVVMPNSIISSASVINLPNPVRTKECKPCHRSR